MASLYFYKRRLSTFQNLRLHCPSFSTATSSTLRTQEEEEQERANKEDFGKKWVTLRPFSPRMDASSIGKEIAGRKSTGKEEPITALKWVRRCCPHLPVSLVQKLFRLRQVRKELIDSNGLCVETDAKQNKVKRVSAKDTLILGDVILLPMTVQNQKHATETKECSRNEIEVDFIRSLVLYKDPAIIVINKPPGMAVQGGVGIRHSIDTLGAMCLKYDYAEPPRLVHRLDRESSGILVLGRTQTSATILHSIFREKTSGVKLNDIEKVNRALQKKYWALVIGTPRLSKGVISAPLAKIVLEDGKSDRITIARNESMSSQHAFTEYKVIKSAHGFSWLELHPRTGRKHQLRVHCAEALGTPIVGDYKYGWKAHKNMEPMPSLNPITEREKLPFGLESGGGSICEKEPLLHLHCRQMILPNIFNVMQHLESSSSSSSLNFDLFEDDMLDLVAPVPSHMKESWEILNY